MSGSRETPEDALARLDRIQHLIDTLGKARTDFAEQQVIADRLRHEVAAARAALEPFVKNKLPT